MPDGNFDDTDIGVISTFNKETSTCLNRLRLCDEHGHMTSQNVATFNFLETLG